MVVPAGGAALALGEIVKRREVAPLGAVVGADHERVGAEAGLEAQLGKLVRGDIDDLVGRLT